MNTFYNVKDCILIDVPTYTDERGAISVMDKELPFQVMRVFWLHHTTFDKWYRKTHKKVYPITITGRPEEDESIQSEAEKVSGSESR